MLLCSLLNSILSVSCDTELADMLSACPEMKIHMPTISKYVLKEVVVSFTKLCTESVIVDPGGDASRLPIDNKYKCKNIKIACLKKVVALLNKTMY